MKPERSPGSNETTPNRVPQVVLLVGDGPEWPAELESLLAGEGYAPCRLSELDGVFPVLEKAPVLALLLVARPLGVSELLILRRVRASSPHTAIVVVTKTPTSPDLKRAFESGATAFLSWPASKDALRQAIDSGGLPAPSGATSPVELLNEDTKPPATAPPAEGVTIHNRLPIGHRYRVSLDEALRACLQGLTGSWDVTVYPVGRAWFHIQVVAPDGSSWSLAIPVQEGPRAEDLAETVRAACARQSRLRPSRGSDRPSSPAAPGGTHK